ncbi:MAG: hypothetical protein AB7S78_06170 [Candidatus Omnitrophota bacterium]
MAPSTTNCDRAVTIHRWTHYRELMAVSDPDERGRLGETANVSFDGFIQISCCYTVQFLNPIKIRQKAGLDDTIVLN